MGTRQDLDRIIDLRDRPVSDIHAGGRTEMWQLLVFGSAYVICIYKIVMECISNIRHGEIFDENLLTLIATLGAFAIGEYPEGLAVVLFFTIGELFEEYAVDRSRRSISALLDIVPESANVIRVGNIGEMDQRGIVGELIGINLVRRCLWTDDRGRLDFGGHQGFDRGVDATRCGAGDYLLRGS